MGANGDEYQGTLSKTAITGAGKYVSEEKKFEYEGELVDGLREGKGRYVSTLDNYTYEGNFKADTMELLPNKLLFIRAMTEEQKKFEDGKAAEYAKKKKAKRDPKKKEKQQVMTDEEQFENKVYWSFGGQPIEFNVEAMFQGEPYPNPAKELKEEEKKESKAKEKNKPKKKDAKEEPDMLTPDPILVTAESNRHLLFTMSISRTKEPSEGRVPQERGNRCRGDNRSQLPIQTSPNCA
eukprot:TRINITY_DN2598_c0_g1_i6.p1 TRINITY_DN2598_c0_g1~~TRINITY_DN2598_c0_g1_i6.p1  ORF type:complete len:237 (-),score=79.77 TRINITY_DN2598_c0_g1_i6:285-995(-)